MFDGWVVARRIKGVKVIDERLEFKYVYNVTGWQVWRA